MSPHEAPSPGGAGGVRRSREERAPGEPTTYRHRVWEDRFAGLACGITAAGEEADYGLGTGTPVGTFLTRWRGLARSLGFRAAAVPRQVHGARVLAVGTEGEAGPLLLVAEGTDGLVTAEAGLLLSVTAADCVPVYLLEPRGRTVALLHAGWRGTAAGVLEAGLELLARDRGVAPGDLHLHLGPAICGRCYEVGPEVPRALGVAEASHVDLREVVVARSIQAGIPPRHITVSGWCTRCDVDRFHSHRGRGSAAGRMAAFLGWSARPTVAGGDPPG